MSKNLVQTQSIEFLKSNQDKDEYKNIYIIKKELFKTLRENKKITRIDKIYPVIRNKSNHILDFDTFEINYDTKNLENMSIDYELAKVSNQHPDIYKFEKDTNTNFYKKADLPPPPPRLNLIAITTGGKKNKKNKKVRKHKGIIQNGGNTGKLKKGYKYSGKILKNGKSQIIKISK